MKISQNELPFILGGIILIVLGSLLEFKVLQLALIPLGTYMLVFHPRTQYEFNQGIFRITKTSLLGAIVYRRTEIHIEDIERVRAPQRLNTNPTVIDELIWWEWHNKELLVSGIYSIHTISGRVIKLAPIGKPLQFQEMMIVLAKALESRRTSSKPF